MIDIQISPELSYALALVIYVFVLAVGGFFCAIAGPAFFDKEWKVFRECLILVVTWTGCVLPFASWYLTQWYAVLAKLRGW